MRRWQRRRCAVTGLAFAAAAAAAVTGCAGGPAIDARYHAQSQDSRVQFIVIHATELGFEASLVRLTTAEVSSHYLIDRDPPRIYRLVPEERRAWHAGKSYWQGQTHLNASSIGIELVNEGAGADPASGYAPYPSAQIDRLLELLRDLERRHGVKPHHILGHSDIQPQCKRDPGPEFPWARLAAEGLIPWPDAAQVAAAKIRFEQQLPEIAWFQRALAAHGFEVPRDGLLAPETRTVLAAFQMKYRPSQFDGAPDAETAALLEVITSPGGLLIRGHDGQARPYPSP